MNWVRIKENHFINGEQLRDIQFINKGDASFYRVFFLYGSNVEVKGFASEKDAFEHADKTFNLTGNAKSEAKPKATRKAAK